MTTKDLKVRDLKYITHATGIDDHVAVALSRVYKTLPLECPERCRAIEDLVGHLGWLSASRR